MRRLITLGLLTGLLATNTGCGLLQAVFNYRPCVMRGECGRPGMCSDGCDESCGPVCPRCHHPIRAVARGIGRAVTGRTGCGGPACPSCDCNSCDSCDACGSCGPIGDPCGSGCYGRSWHRGPLSCVFALFMGCGTWGCNSCGERYWGDFYSDPPDCWDPCDCQGNFTGGGCQSCGGGGCQTCGGMEGGFTTGDATRGGCQNCGGGSSEGSGVFEEYSRGPIGNQNTNGQIVSRSKMVTQSDRVVSGNTHSAQQPHRAVRQQ